METKMNGKRINGFKEQLNGYGVPSMAAYVLEGLSSDDVARAMIENGQQKQPFYIFNMDEVYRRVQHFRDLMPRVKMFYAMKSNDTDVMLRLAIALGLGFDCASPGEIYKIRQHNVNPKSIIFAMPTKSSEDMEYARKAGVKHTTFDTSFELQKIKKFWPDARLLIRIRVDGMARIRLGEKFGCDFETEAIDLLDEAASLGLKVAGVAFHVGSMCYSPESFVVGLQQARALFDHEARAGRGMTIVDIGGGFLSDRTDRIDKVSCLVNKTLEELFPDPSVQVIAEPGRYLCDSAFKLFCRIIAVRQVIRSNVPVNMIYMNNGTYGTMRFEENFHKFKKFQRSSEIEPDVNEDFILWGPTCDSLDRVMKDVQVKLPRCNPDDWLELDIHGGYTFCFSSLFSSLGIPRIRSVITKELWNYIKTSSVFAPADFVLDPDISAPLPSTLPPVATGEIYEHSEIPTLNV